MFQLKLSLLNDIKLDYEMLQEIIFSILFWLSILMLNTYLRFHFLFLHMNWIYSSTILVELVFYNFLSSGFLFNSHQFRDHRLKFRSLIKIILSNQTIISVQMVTFMREPPFLSL